MALILDASAALAWLITRTNSAEAALAEAALKWLHSSDGLVPALWYPEVANGILVAERRKTVDTATSASFLDLLGQLPIREDEVRPALVQDSVLSLARNYNLTGYDAIYLELVLRTGQPLATFDRQLAEAARKAGGKVFGHTA